MDKIYIIGDIHTITAFRLAGVEGTVSNADTVNNDLKNVMKKDNAVIILITRELAERTGDTISDCNLNMVKPVIVEIPGILDDRGFGKSIMSYITEALGISI